MRQPCSIPPGEDGVADLSILLECVYKVILNAFPLAQSVLKRASGTSDTYLLRNDPHTSSRGFYDVQQKE